MQSSLMITINIKQQTLQYAENLYSISSGKNGVGTQQNSGCTPLGRFKICAKIGAQAKINTVFVARKPTGEIYSTKLRQKFPNRDWILTRILWLDGLDIANNNTKSRYIYIHGTADETTLGVANSKGCIRMNNLELIQLFEAVKVNDEILIQ